MAKKKETIEEIKAKEAAIDSVEGIAEVQHTADEIEEFINRKLRVINELSDRAKAKRLAERVIRNNRKG